MEKVMCYTAIWMAMDGEYYATKEVASIDRPQAWKDLQDGGTICDKLIMLLAGHHEAFIQTPIDIVPGV
jgi:hypothetical protein